NGRGASSCRRRIRRSSRKSSSRSSVVPSRSLHRSRRRSANRSTSSAFVRRSTGCSGCSMPEAVRVHYRPEVLELLLVHGVRPTDVTRPELVRDFVRDLYKYEIRRLRERYLRRAFPTLVYSGMFDELRRRYPVLALQAREFVEP